MVFGDWIFFGLTVAGLFILRRRLGTPASHGTPLYPWLPGFFVVVAVIVVIATIREHPTQSGIGALLLLSGLPIYYWFKSRSAGRTS